MQQYRILVCEDEPLLRDLMASHLAMNGFIVWEAQDGAECLRQLENKTPDIILLDLNMPTMGGLSVLKKLKEMGIDCPIMIITGSSDSVTIKEAMALGVKGILMKPFTLSMINQEIEKLF